MGFEKPEQFLGDGGRRDDDGQGKAEFLDRARHETEEHSGRDGRAGAGEPRKGRQRRLGGPDPETGGKGKRPVTVFPGDIRRQDEETGRQQGGRSDQAGGARRGPPSS